LLIGSAVRLHGSSDLIDAVYCEARAVRVCVEPIKLAQSFVQKPFGSDKVNCDAELRTARPFRANVRDFH
jgi:hypothetical protein